MYYRLFFTGLTLLCIVAFAACEKWKDKPAQDLGLSSKYCNNPQAVNYNHGFPGIEDSTVCVFPTDPFTGSYTFRDSIYYPETDTATEGDLIHFTISPQSRTSMVLEHFCGSGNKFSFTANRYYHAASDSILGAGLQLMCRDQDTLLGALDYRGLDSSLYIEFKVVSDTGTSTHRGRAYKK